MFLAKLWFVIDVIFWMGYMVLEGFDFGVGMLHPFVGRNDLERRIAVNSIGPFWDGNEVWLIVAGAVIFAAFPAWYATMFSSYYLALLLLLVVLMVRGVSFEYGRKVDDARWHTIWRWVLAVGSALIPFVVGVALGDLLHGLPINRAHQYTGSFWGLFTGYGVWTGITFVVMSVLMGATYLALKTTGDLRRRAVRVAAGAGVVSIVVVWGFVTWTHLGFGPGFIPNPVEVIAVLAVIAAAWLASVDKEGWAFASAAVGMAATVGSIFVELYPHLMISTTNAAYSLTIANSASNSYSLTVMTVVAVIFFPLVLLYQTWTYRVFKRRLTGPSAPAAPPTPGPGSGPGPGGIGGAAPADIDGPAGHPAPSSGTGGTGLEGAGP